jgi:SAM-dependent methyltransferase
MIKPVRYARVLEIGCHTGEWIIDRVRNIENPDIYGIDLYQKHINLSRKLGIKAIIADAEKKLPFKSNFFDIISANQIIEHLVNIDEFIQELYRVLKPGGYVVLSTENLSSWHNIFALCMGWQAFSQHISTIKHIGNPLRLVPSDFQRGDVHMKIFTLVGLLEIFELHGFTIEKTFGAGYYPLPQPFSRAISNFDTKHAAFIGIIAYKI